MTGNGTHNARKRGEYFTAEHRKKVPRVVGTPFWLAFLACVKPCAPITTVFKGLDAPMHSCSRKHRPIMIELP